MAVMEGKAEATVEQLFWADEAQGHLNGLDKRVLSYIYKRYVKPLAGLLDTAYAELCGHAPGDFSKLTPDEKLSAYRKIVLARDKMVNNMTAEERAGWTSFPLVEVEGGEVKCRIWSGSPDVELPSPDCFLIGNGVQQVLAMAEHSLQDPLMDDMATMLELRLIRRKEALGEDRLRRYLVRLSKDTLMSLVATSKAREAAEGELKKIGEDIVSDIVKARLDEKELEERLSLKLKEEFGREREVAIKPGCEKYEQLMGAFRTISSVVISEASKRFGAILDAAKREVVVNEHVKEIDVICLAGAQAHSMLNEVMVGAAGRVVVDADAQTQLGNFPKLFTDFGVSLERAATDIGEEVGRRIEREMLAPPFYDEAQLRYTSNVLDGADTKVARAIVEAFDWVLRDLPGRICETVVRECDNRVVADFLRLSNMLQSYKTSKDDNRVEVYAHWKASAEDAIRQAYEDAFRAGEYSGPAAVLRGEAERKLGRLWHDEKRVEEVAVEVAELTRRLLDPDVPEESIGAKYAELAGSDVANNVDKQWWRNATNGDRRECSIRNLGSDKNKCGPHVRSLEDAIATISQNRLYTKIVAMVAEGAEAEAGEEMERAIERALKEMGVESSEECPDGLGLAEFYMQDGTIRTLPVTGERRRVPASPRETLQSRRWRFVLSDSIDGSQELECATISLFDYYWGLDERSANRVHEAFANEAGGKVSAADSRAGSIQEALAAIGICMEGDSERAMTGALFKPAADTSFPLATEDALRTYADAVAASAKEWSLSAWPLVRHRLVEVVEAFRSSVIEVLARRARWLRREGAGKGEQGTLGLLLNMNPSNVDGWFDALLGQCERIAAAWRDEASDAEITPLGEELYPEYAACLAGFMLVSCMPTLTRADALRFVVAEVPPDVPDVFFSVQDHPSDAGTWQAVIPRDDTSVAGTTYGCNWNDAVRVKFHRSFIPPEWEDGKASLGFVELLSRHGASFGAMIQEGGTAPGREKVSSGEAREFALSLAETVAETVVGTAIRDTGGTRKAWGDVITYVVARSVLDCIDTSMVDGKLQGDGIADYKAVVGGEPNLINSIRKALAGIRNAAREPIENRLRAINRIMTPEGFKVPPADPPVRYATYAPRLDRSGAHSSFRIP